MKEHLLFIGSTGVLGRNFCERHSDRFIITGLSRSEPPTNPITPRHVRANVTQCNWEAVLNKVAADIGKPKHIVYSVFNRYERFEWKNSPDWFIDTEMNLHVNALLKLIRQLFHYWEGTEGNTLTVISSMAAIRSEKPDLFGYAAAKAAQNMIVTQAALLLPNVKVRGVCPNSFPARMSTHSVSDTVVGTIDHGRNGEIVQMKG